MSYEALLFDMDGVIIDTHQSVTAFWQDAAEKYQVRLTQADFSQHVYGCPATHTLDALFPHLSTDERRSILERMLMYETNLTYTEVKGAVAFLRSLRECGVPTALVTSGARWKVEAVATQIGLDGLFSAWVIESDIQKGKPDPECYLLGARRLQRAPERCIVFEDAISGVKAAVASGALCIGVQSPSTPSHLLLQAGACCVVPDLTVTRLLAHKEAGETRLHLQIGTERTLPLMR
jgi:HAD superfamily hydrolase (TIGR01509 family)